MRILTESPLLRRELMKQKLIRIEMCSEEENNKYKEMDSAGERLPNGVYCQSHYAVEDLYARIIPSDLSDADELALIETAKLLKMSVIQKWISFWGVLSIIGAASGLIALLINLFR